MDNELKKSIDALNSFMDGSVAKTPPTIAYIDGKPAGEYFMDKELREQIEKVAADMFEHLCDPLTWEAADQQPSLKKNYLKLGKFHIQRTLEARIDEIVSNKWCEDMNDRIFEIKHQLQQLKDG